MKWLIRHKKEWANPQKRAVTLLKQAGIVAPTTYYRDVNLAKAIELAKAEIWGMKPYVEE